MNLLPDDYPHLLDAIKGRIRQAQIKATLSVNAEMIRMYLEVGIIILERQQREGWGASIIPRLARDIRNDLSGVKGFSERNIGYMIRFAREYGNASILQQAVAKLPRTKILEGSSASKVAAQLAESVFGVPWSHNLILMEKVKNPVARLWYVRQTLEHGWSRNILQMQIKSDAYARAGQAVTNFERTLPAEQSDLAHQALKDPFVFDFLTLEEPFHERELETGLVRHLERFLLELGQGFSFVGRQYHLQVSGNDFYLDLVFYHLKLRCFVVIELKKGDFKPEYAGKMNFYCSVVDDHLRHETDKRTIGLILCQSKDRILAEYALRDIHKPIGVSDYELTRALPEELKSSLPTIEEIETELSADL